jgi:epoxyqueuosine reductase
VDALRERIRGLGPELGFHRLGFAAATPLPHAEFLRRWLDRGMAGEMAYLAPGAPSRADPRTLLPTARTVIVAVARYHDGRPEALAQEHGRIARYARGLDYHRLLRLRLQRLAERIEGVVGRAFDHRVVVDSAALLEREAAMAAGAGFIGKNTMLITPGLGSYTVLGELLLSLELPPDAPARARCGRCDLCLRACPTGALAAPWLLDARRCIAYLTIEHRRTIDEPLRTPWGDWVFGCDDCQQACPFNRPTPRSRAEPRDLELDPRGAPAGRALSELLGLRSGDYRRLVRGRPLGRVPRRAWRRNAAIAAGNAPSPSATLVDAVERAAVDDEHLVSEAARWARARLVSGSSDPP